MQNSTDCRVFALIIGIDEYKELDRLNGCVNDARAFKQYLTHSLRVPDSEAHIKLLTNAEATRANIIAQFKKHLIENRRIRAYGGDTIIIFFSGHGSRARSFENVYAPNGWVETICPQDERSKDKHGKTVHGIPDYTLHHLLQQLAAAKGNNITAVFDSCNSGGLARGTLTPRFSETVTPIPADLDSELVITRGATQAIPHGFRYKYAESHVLLAACRADQTAFEDTIDGVPRGRFSASLVRSLQRAALEETTYSDLIARVNRWADQDPLAEGANKLRALFNGTYPPTGRRAVPVASSERAPGCFEIEVGSVEGVVPGTEFLVTDAGNSPLGHLVAHTVSLNHAVLKAKHGNRRLPAHALPVGAKATVSAWNNREMVIRVVVAPGVDAAAAKALFPERNLKTKTAAHTGQLEALPKKFVEAGPKGHANIKLSQRSKGVFVLDRLDGIFKERHLPPAEFTLPRTDFARLPIIMDAIAHFNYFLRKDHNVAPIRGVSIEMHVLEGPILERKPGPDIFRKKVAHVKDEILYGFTICNRSHYDLYPYLFYFDPVTYKIENFYLSDSPTMRPPLPASRDGKETTRHAIGYGHGAPAFMFEPTAGREESGFLKLFVSTEHLDMRWIEQDSPFARDFVPSGSGRLNAERETVEKGQAWDALHAVVTIQT